MNEPIEVDTGHRPEATTASWRGPGSRSNLPSWSYLMAVGANTALILAWAARDEWCHGPLAALLALLVLVQAIAFIGVQEVKHQCVHRQFLHGSAFNDAVGMLTGALFLVNFTGYRAFHLEHHRRTCQADDPEGLLYGKTWTTRWLAACGPYEQLWVALHINWYALRYLPRARRARWHLNNAVVALVWIGLACALYAAPRAMSLAWLLPYVLFAWLDFLPTQAEHYDVPVGDTGPRRRPDDISLELWLPGVLSWLTLHRTLHRIHHEAPATRWFEARARARALDSSRPGGRTALGPFVRRWMKRGPRLWA